MPPNPLSPATAVRMNGSNEELVGNKEQQQQPTGGQAPRHRLIETEHSLNFVNDEDVDYVARGVTTAAASNVGGGGMEETEYDDDMVSETTEEFVNEDADDQASQEVKLLAKREESAVGGLRVLTFLVLILSTIAIALCVYFYIATSEYNQFQSQFREESQKVLQSIGTALDLTLGGIDSLVVNIVSFTKATNQTWPFIVIPDFAVRAEKSRSLTKSVYLSIYPYVEGSQREQWQAFSAEYGPEWVQQSLELQEREGLFVDVIDELNISASNITYWNVIYDYDELSKPPDEMGMVGLNPSDPGPYMPIWQTSPLIPRYGSPYNWDLLSLVGYNQSMVTVLETQLVVLSEAYLVFYPDDMEAMNATLDEANFISTYLTSDEDPMEPASDILYPIMIDASDWIWQHSENYNTSEHTLGGFLSVTFYWRDLIKGILPIGSNGIIVVFENVCNPTFTYQINGPSVMFLGAGDFHEPQFDDLMLESGLLNLGRFSVTGEISFYTGVPIDNGYCPFTIKVYPSTIMLDLYVTNNRVFFTIGAIMIFVFTSAVFLLYDWWVERRQRIVMQSAVRTNEIVASFFPSTVRNRLYQHQAEKKRKEEPLTSCGRKNAFRNDGGTISSLFEAGGGGVGNSRVSGFSGGGSGPAGAGNSAVSNMDPNLPIADFFPETTILFADLAGFTAWSSQREPAQVFFMLETLYESFDKIAKRRGVFKIETIGDCYVAVCGLPRPRKNHAVVMARFAADIRDAMNSMTPELELSLGPGTANLLIRVGLHSGSCTGGVLRGEKCLFTLFGDTVNTASRMESNGKPNRIHCSQATADLLIEAHKADWLSPREELITAKGKGQMQTYWVEPKGRSSSTISGSDVDMSVAPNGESEPIFTDTAKMDRLIEWNVAVFEELIKKLIAFRQAKGQPAISAGNIEWWGESGGSTTPRDEMVDAVDMVTQLPVTEEIPFDQIELSPEVLDQLHSYISVIAHTYRANAFHNFDHASHVNMFLKKLFQRIATSKTLSKDQIYLHSFGGGSDPLARVAIMFASLIHDVDHPGIPNSFVIREDRTIATRYRNRSVAEQHSIDVAWNLFMEPLFDDLRAVLFTSQEDLRRFRQLFVNCVLATDMFDRELRENRDKRWDMAYNDSAIANSSDRYSLNLKATITLEHVMLASDVCHTMQPWSIYLKWSESLFDEMYGAYLSGRITRDPAENWYEGELLFFDDYVIPIATKLRDCQIFGSASREFLDCVFDNRQEWENKGRMIVEEMKQSFENLKKVEI